MLKRGWLLVAGLAVFGCLALSQETTRKHLSVSTLNSSRAFNVSAMNIAREGKYPSAIRLSGDVEIIVPMCYRVTPAEPLTCQSEMALTGDSVILHEDTGEIEASGAIRVTPIRPVR